MKSVINRIKGNFSNIRKNILVKDIMSKEVVTLQKESSVKKSMILMTKYDFSSIVIKEDKKPIGIITEKDVMKRVFLKDLDPGKTKLQEVMTKSLKTASPNTSILKASNKLKQHHIKKLIVVDRKGNLVGILSQTDIIESMNRIYNSYKNLLWNPWFYFLLFILISILFIVEILIFQLK